MKAKDLIQFLGKSVDDLSFLEFLETNNFDIKKLPRQDRKKRKSETSIFLLHGIQLCFAFTNNQLLLYRIEFFKPKSDGLQPAHEIKYPFGLHLNQKKSEYEAILGDFVGFDEPQSRNYDYKNYDFDIFFEFGDNDKKMKRIEITIKEVEN